jgi:hypothetical protein
VKAHSPSTPLLSSVASRIPSSTSLSGPANAPAISEATVVAISTEVVVARASRPRRSGSSSSNQKRTKASPRPARSRMLTRMIAVSSVSA